MPELHTATHTIEELHRREQIRSALAQLPLLYRLPLVLFTWSGYSTQEIAAALDCPNNTVKSRLYRARRLFIQAYQD
jgi:RNA polymerase sigma-70 factor (ECF subfamily)